jgi:hypothetical protein
MGANAVDNSNLKNLGRDSNTTGFVPSVTFEYDASAKEVDFTEASAFPSGVALKKTRVSVHDKSGGQVDGFILPAEGSDSGHDGTTTLDVSSLDLSKPLDVKATVIADDDMLVADGGAYNIGAAGEVGSWDIQKNALT